MGQYLAGRGCIFQYKPNGQGGAGMYALDPPLKGDAASPILIESITSRSSDIVEPVITLTNKRILYTFGQSFGDLTVQGCILLGPVGSAATGFNKMQEFFETNRVTKSKTAISASLPGGNAVKFFLVGLQIGETNPEYHVHDFSLVGLLVPPGGK